MYQKTAEATATKRKTNQLIIIVCCISLGLLIALTAIMQNDEQRLQTAERTSLAVLKENHEIATGVIDPCHYDIDPACPNRQFVALVPKIKGIKAFLAASHSSSYPDLPDHLDRIVCQKTEFVGESSFAPHELKVSPRESGRFEAILLVCKGDQIIEVPFKNSIEIAQDHNTITPYLILHHLPW